jgi:hypothetical protein
MTAMTLMTAIPRAWISSTDRGFAASLESISKTEKEST